MKKQFVFRHSLVGLCISLFEYLRRYSEKWSMNINLIENISFHRSSVRDFEKKVNLQCSNLNGTSLRLYFHWKFSKKIELFEFDEMIKLNQNLISPYNFIPNCSIEMSLSHVYLHWSNLSIWRINSIKIQSRGHYSLSFEYR